MNCFCFLKYITLFWILLFSANLLPAQSSVTTTAKNYKYLVGINFIEGYSAGYEKKVTYEYKPYIFQIEIEKPLTRSSAKTFKLDYFLQPQFNITKYKDFTQAASAMQYVHSWETGINIGLLLYTNIFTNLNLEKQTMLYVAASSGPHYIHSSPSRQSKGFIFSDNFNLGLRVPLSKKILFNIKCGIRHASNAGFKNPNKGLDNILVGSGITVRVK